MSSFFHLPSSLILILLICGGCAHQPVDSHGEELKQLQSTLAQQEVQGKRVEERQDQLLSHIQQIQSQLLEQQKLIEAKPQVIEKITQVACPPLPAEKQPAKSKEQPNTDKQIVGLRERVLLTGVNLIMSAKVSPQLAHSILDARNIQMFERNSDEWVRFTLYNPENKEPHVLERKLLSFQNIQGANKATERRPIVEVRFTVGKLTQKGQFVLADRSGSEFPIVLGRNLLRDVMLVDVSGEYMTSIKREEKDAREENKKSETKEKTE
ncbi:MAG: ATP-dependent zinc protease [Cellvibrio sp.]|jgi:hypothetical protein|nr:ATP-dependent zinc protease [Cellvibrio sp.]